MKTFKRTLSCFLALLMIFSSFSMLSATAAGEKKITVDTKFFAQNAEGKWDEVTEVKAGSTVKARVYFDSNYKVGTSQFFWVYSKNFMELDLTGWQKTGTQYDFPHEKNPVINTSATAIPTKNGWSGFMTTATTPGGSESGDIAENLVLDEYLTNEFFDDKGWIAINLKNGTSTEIITPSDYIFEFTFKVKETPTASEGFLYLEPEAIQDTDYYDYAFTFIGEAKSDASFASTPGYQYDYAYTLTDNTKKIKLAAPETATHAVTYSYAGDVPADAKAPDEIQVAEGAAITEPTVTIPAGYTLTWAGIPADGKMGTTDVAMVGTWAKITYNVTYRFEGPAPEGATLPEAGTTTVGDALAEPTVTIPEGYTLTWAVTGATKNEHGVYIAGANNVEFVGTWTKAAHKVTYAFTNAGPEGVEAPAEGSTSVGATIAAPAVKVPAGGALAVDRELFSEYITDKIKSGFKQASDKLQP